jgi:opacity protein-like surface antigen
MKKMILLTAALLIAGVVSTSGQAKNDSVKNGKKNQVDLYNDFYISYGTGTLYYFIDNEAMTANTLSGTFLAGFNRSINSVIAVGFQLSYTCIGRSETIEYYNYPYPYPTTIKNDMTDNLWQGMANVRFRYLNNPTFCMYSGIGMGVTMDYYQKTEDGTTSKGQKLLPAGQLTLLGFRIGRALSFFGEFGIGTNSILSAGVSYKFSD